MDRERTSNDSAELERTRHLLDDQRAQVVTRLGVMPPFTRWEVGVVHQSAEDLVDGPPFLEVDIVVADLEELLA